MIATAIAIGMFSLSAVILCAFGIIKLRKRQMKYIEIPSYAPPKSLKGLHLLIKQNR